MTEDIKPEPSKALDEHKEYLAQSFGKLIEEIGDGYGKPLQDELMSRMEQTIAEFHDEVTSMVEQLKARSRKRYEKLASIASRHSGKGADQGSDKPDEVTEWELRLKKDPELSHNAEVDDKKLKGQKKSRFRRKKSSA
jgi:hypothetical protein